MTQFSKCISIINGMEQRDQDYLLERLEHHTKGGIPAWRAQILAAKDALGRINDEFESLGLGKGLTQEETRLVRARGIRAYHASPFDFDSFDTEKIGSGEGAQAFGWGLYFTDSDDVASWYSKVLPKSVIERHTATGPKKILSGAKSASLFVGSTHFTIPGNSSEDFSLGAEQLPKALAAREVEAAIHDLWASKLFTSPRRGVINGAVLALARTRLKIKEGRLRGSNTGNAMAAAIDILESWRDESIGLSPAQSPTVFAVDLMLDPARTMLWDAGIDSQPDVVATALRDVIKDHERYCRMTPGSLLRKHPSRTAGDWYKSIAVSFDKTIQKQLSLRLLESGVQGISYPAGQGRMEGRNYVVFHNETVKVVAKAGTVGDVVERSKQHPARYLSARDPALRKWFGNSKVVDSKGEPLVAYHGSRMGGFEQANPGKLLFFAARPEVASEYAGNDGIVQPVYLRLENPLEVDAKGGMFYRLMFEGNLYGMEGLSRIARSRGHDGLMVRNVDDVVADGGLLTDVFVTFGRKGQIKSAIGNNGEFDAKNPDIRKSARELPRGYVGEPTAEEDKLEVELARLMRKQNDAWRIGAQAAADYLEDKLIKSGAAEGAAAKELAPKLAHTVLGKGDAFDPETSSAFKQYRDIGLAMAQLRTQIRELIDARVGPPEFDEMQQPDQYDRPQIRTKAFREWFDGSRVEKDGVPLIAFHGSPVDITEFRTGEQVRDKVTNGNWLGQMGAWFAAPGGWGYEAGNAESTASGFGETIYPVYLSIKRPKPFEGYWDLQQEVADAGGALKYRKQLEADGYDGLVIYGSETDGGATRNDWVAFKPTQIKSAIGNNGDFDETNPDIRFSARIGSRGLIGEVAPFPASGTDSPERLATERGWDEMTESEKLAATRDVYRKQVERVVSDMGLRGWTVQFSSGQYEGKLNPNFIIDAPKSATSAEIEELASAIGYILDQKAMITFDESNTSDGYQASYIKVKLPDDMDADTVKQLRGWIAQNAPQAGGDTLRDGALVYGNFNDGVSDAEFKAAIEKAVDGFEAKTGTAIDVSGLSQWQSGYIEPPSREEYLKGTRYGTREAERGMGAGGDAVRDSSRDRRAWIESVGRDAVARRQSWIDNSEAGRARAARRHSRGNLEGVAEAEREYGKPQQGSVSRVGVHFSQQRRDVLSSLFHGTGHRGAERNRLELPGAIKDRLYFYVDKGDGIVPEAGVGGAKHTIKLNNLYDISKDERGYKNAAGNPNPMQFANNWERMVRDAGFDGWTADNGGNQAFAVLLGKHEIPMEDEGVRYSARPAGATWDAPHATKFDDFVYKSQNKMIDAKRVIESITKATGKIANDLNVYLQEELFHGRAAKRTQDFGNDELKPMLELMRANGLTIGDVEEYLHARHAKEANAVIASREPSMPDGGSGMMNAEVDRYFARLMPTQEQKLKAVAAQVDAMIAKTRQMYADYNLESQATVDGWGDMFQHYVPLQREDKGGGGMGIGQGFSVKGKETRGRTGSKRKVVDILANIAMQREKVIVRGEKNRVSQALVGLAIANPNSDFWDVGPPPTERVYDPKTNSVVDRPDPLFKSRENVLVAKVANASGGVDEVAVRFNEDNERALRMAQALKNLDAANLEGLLGVSAKITRYFAAVNTQYNPVFGVVNLVRDVQDALIGLGGTPLEKRRGRIARDTISALSGIYADMRAARQGKHPTSQWSTLWEEFQGEGGQTGYRDMFATSKDRAEALQKILTPHGWMDSGIGKVFTANGALRAPMEKAQGAAEFIFNWLSDYNEAMENGVRLATYKAALDKGMTKQEAASFAKNITVNFNRKGQVAQQAGALYAFFNAAMQGTARIGRTLFAMDDGDIKTLRLSPTGKKVVYGGMLIGTMQALSLAAAGFGDDDPPDFVRERNLVIPIGGNSYITIPMPQGLHVLPGIGRQMTEFALAGFDRPQQRAIKLFGMFADAFNPIGNAGLSMQTLAPTALDPLVALTENKDFTGKPIARTSSNKAIPGFTQHKDSATAIGKLISEAINGLTGGNAYVAGAISPTPDQIDYLIGQATGGVGRELSKLEQTTVNAITGEDIPNNKIPLLGRFYGDTKSQASQAGEFYGNVNKLNELETEIKGMVKDGKGAEASELRASKPEAYLIAQANVAERQVQRLRREKRELVARGAGREEVKAKEEQITRVMTRLNTAMDELQAKAK